ncbi:hypothetical protein CspeluHIS016_0902040 [Cutaneotrichosporon spelunceum]|uniref:Ricin B lectin domain-containing protein n=1 Tax=Cutaneotrichosporon spelunceum TaxID=1672016 RepID=A0AAD3U038_9TREE|nr:hypothetical protein CspeluHIS016_0902040 [Cutaneotrichosporon spelunceum]
MLILALAYLAIGVSAAAIPWSNATLGTRWTAAQLANSTLVKEEMLVRLHWRKPTPFCEHDEDTASVAKPTTFSGTSSTKSITPNPSGTNAPPRLCIGAFNDGMPALVPCHSLAATIAFGTHHHIALGSGCLTTPASPGNGDMPTVEDCDAGSEAQIWSWSRVEGGWSVSHGDFCLDATGGVYEVGTPLQLWECEDQETNKNQVFGFQRILLIDYGSMPFDLDGITVSLNK